MARVVCVKQVGELLPPKKSTTTIRHDTPLAVAHNGYSMAAAIDTPLCVMGSIIDTTAAVITIPSTPNMLGLIVNLRIKLTNALALSDGSSKTKATRAVACELWNRMKSEYAMSTTSSLVCTIDHVLAVLSPMMAHIQHTVKAFWEMFNDENNVDTFVKCTRELATQLQMCLYWKDITGYLQFTCEFTTRESVIRSAVAKLLNTTMTMVDLNPYLDLFMDVLTKLMFSREHVILSSHYNMTAFFTDVCSNIAIATDILTQLHEGKRAQQIAIQHEATHGQLQLFPNHSFMQLLEHQQELLQCEMNVLFNQVGMNISCLREFALRHYCLAALPITELHCMTLCDHDRSLFEICSVDILQRVINLLSSISVREFIQNTATCEQQCARSMVVFFVGQFIRLLKMFVVGSGCQQQK